MLALYDADANALQRGPAGTGDGSPLDETALYEELLTAFARHEVGKSGAALPDREISREVQRELQRLSLVAFGIVNRRREWITEAELENDLAALLGTRERTARDFKASLTQADAAVGRFVRGTCARRIPSSGRRLLAGLLIDVLAQSASRTEDRHAGYRPAPLATSSRHGIYSANLVLLILTLKEAVTASELFHGSVDPVRAWNRRVLLWRSALTEPEWTDLALAMSLRHTWNGSNRDLEIRLSADPPAPPEPVDPYWLYQYYPGHHSRGQISWYRPYWNRSITRWT